MARARAPGPTSGGVGTFSGVNADSYDADGKLIPQEYHGRTRRERHEELVVYAIRGGIQQARIAHEMSGGRGRIHMNVLWEMAASERVLHGVLEGAKGLIHGVTCGAGMPYRIAEICNQVWHLLLSHRVLGPRLSRAVEARLPQVPRSPGRRGVRGSLAGRRPQRTFQQRRSDQAGIATAARRRTQAHHARRMRPGRNADLHGRRRLVPAGMGGMDRQSGAGAGGIPVRHPAATDPGKPDLRCLEATAADA